MRHGIVQHNRHAIRRKNRQHQARIPSDKRIRLGHPLVNRERASPPIVGGNDPHSGAMHLPRKHELPEVSAHRPSHPPPILEHSPRVIPDSKTQIQRLVGAHRHPATPASNERLNSQPLKRRPTQNVKPGEAAQRAASRATRGSSINGVSHRPRVYRRPGEVAFSPGQPTSHHFSSLETDKPDAISTETDAKCTECKPRTPPTALRRSPPHREAHEERWPRQAPGNRSPTSPAGGVR